MKRVYPIFYMFVVTAFFSSILIGFTRFTQARVEANRQFVYERAVLKVIDELYDPNMGRMEMHRCYVEDLEGPSEQSGGAYVYRSDGDIQGYALPFEGQGFWAPIKGVIGIASDKVTVTGIYFYEQNETPGLGAEITKEGFRSQFENLQMSKDRKAINFRRAGQPLEKSEVHAVTGATQTCTRLEGIINEAIKSWQKKMNGADR